MLIMSTPGPLWCQKLFLYFSVPVLGKAKHGISPFPGDFFQVGVAFGSFHAMFCLA